MKYQGKVYDYGEEDGVIKEAIVTHQRIAISFEQGGENWQIAADSNDGYLYQGVLSAGQKPDCIVELGLYKGKSGALMVFGTWRSVELGNAFQFLFRLFPSAPPKKATTKPRKPARKGR
jgi:hypothetical protein